MSEPDPLLSPKDLHRRESKFGIQMQRRHREAGDFIPHLVIANRVFYRESAIKKWFDEQEAKAAGRSQDDS